MKFPANAMTIGDRRFFYSGARRWYYVQFYDADGNPTDNITVAATMREAMEMDNPINPPR